MKHRNDDCAIHPNDAGNDDFMGYLQDKINRLSWLIQTPEVKTHHRNFLRVAIVTKHALIDFARILKGRPSAQESLWKGGPCERQKALMIELQRELIGAGLRLDRKEKP